MTRQEFISAIAAAAQKYAPQYGICVVSPIIAQACLESAYGTSDKAKYHNYFGLKYRKNRVNCNNGYFSAGGSEQHADGSYRPINTDWYSFSSLEKGVEGYFQFINIPNYYNLKGVKDPHKYLEIIKSDNYATSLNYVKNVYNVILKNNLTKYDNIFNKEENQNNCPNSTTKYSNSSLVDYTVYSQNHSGKRTHPIDRITPHCVVGQLSAKRIGECFGPGRKASCNYGIGYDGKVCLVVDEANRSWCSSSNANDQRAVTIEVASDKTHPYAFKEAAYDKLIELCVDICKRNHKNTLIWIEDKNTALSYNPKSNEMLLTVHRWFARKSCPGDWMFSRMGNLASEVTKKLNGYMPVTPKPIYPEPELPKPINHNTNLTIGQEIHLKENSTYFNGKSIPNWVFDSKIYYRGKSPNGIIFSINKTGPITGVTQPENVLELKTNSFLVRILAAALNIRKGPGVNYPITGVIRDRGIYTIVEEKNNWGKLKSGVGWISLRYAKKQ